MLFSATVVADLADPITLLPYSVHLAVAALVGLWGASGPRLNLERACVAAVASLTVGVLASLFASKELVIGILHFSPTTAIAFLVAAAFRRFGWRVRKVLIGTGIRSTQFSIRHLLAVTAAVSVTVVLAQQVQWAIQRTDGMILVVVYGTAVAIGLLLAVWAFLGAGSMTPKVVVCLFAVEALSLLILYAVQASGWMAVALVSIAGYCYFLAVSIPLAVLRSCGYRFVREPSANFRRTTARQREVSAWTESA
jgi:hypothetical protein